MATPEKHPQPADLPPHLALFQMLKGSDLNMMINVGGRERTDAEFRALFDAAGFRLTRIIPTGLFPSILEGVKV